MSKQTVAIIDYGSGNLRSAAKAFERMAHEAGVSAEILVTGDADRVAAADRIVLPGVGAFADCAGGLAAVDGMIDALTQAVIQQGRPFLGICVGMQLMAERGVEFGTTPGLGWIPGDVVALKPIDPTLKIPHMGWNDLSLDASGHPVLDGVATGDHAYFVHSFHLAVSNPSHRLAMVSYGGPVTAIIGRDNLVGTQFHPEKSQRTGLHIIANFLTWRP